MEALVRDLLAELAVEHDVAGTPAPVTRGDFSPRPRNCGECEAVSGVFDVGEDRCGDALVDVEGGCQVVRIDLGRLVAFGLRTAFARSHVGVTGYGGGKA
jgi:hypothetical protein|tara:strand:- start:635 stop:934 length:300 start_codon:yes stop_codon:yes gene_type:complete